MNRKKTVALNEESEILKTIMGVKKILLMAMAALIAGCSTPPEVTKNTAQPKTLQEFQAVAAKFDSVLALPQFETTAEQITQSLTNAIKQANSRLDAIGKLSPGQVTLENTIGALDGLVWEAGKTANRIYLMKETSKDGALRQAATDAIKAYEDWAVGLDYREDVYRAIKAYADSKPNLKGEDAKLLKEVMRDYRRAGLELPKDQRQEVERLRKEVARLATDFQSNITAAKKGVVFTRKEVEGVPESLLSQIKTGDDEYTLMVNVTFQRSMVLENAKSEATRKKVETELYQLAMDKNLPLLTQILDLRRQIASKLGYKSWADFIIEVKMAKDAKTARTFLEDLNKGLQPKFEAEVAEFQKIKARETGNPNAKIELWDWRYFSNQLRKERYTVDAEQLRVYFPYQPVLDGMFRIYQDIFRLRLQEIEAPYKWTDDLKLYAVSDSKTGEPLGMFYLDMFPREGKYNHFAQFGIIEGKRLPNGKYQRPTVALICNFPPPSADKPSLLSHQEVETLFHEFGHALHSILTRANYARFAGTSVPRDFVEAPSQMLENWVWKKEVLDTFAHHYADPQKKIPAEILAKLEEARLATIGTFYRRQLSFGLVDLALHSDYKPGDDPVKMANDIIARVTFPPPDDTAFVAYFGHLMGYDAGYYGYAWADAIAADMNTVFKKAGYFNKDAGMKLREEIYAPGSSRDVEISVQKFLGRKQSIQPFLESIGIGKN